MQRMSVRFEGHVQGVGFRYSAVECSKAFDLTGYVRNERDGSVYLVAEGDEDDLNGFLQAVRHSGVGRFVTKESMSWEPATGEFNSFGVGYGP